MADNNFQTLQYVLSTGNGGARGFQTEVNKKTGASVTYETTRPLQKDAVLRSDPITNPDGTKTFKSSLIGNSATASTEEKKFLLESVDKQANIQRATYVNKNFTEPQKATDFKGMPGVKNTSTDPNSSTPQTTGTQQDLLNNASVKDGGFRETYDTLLTYPIDRANTKQDHILFTMKRYAPRAFDSNSASSKSESTFGDRIGGGEGGARVTYGSVSLPIQPNIADANSVGWKSDDINAADAALQSLFKSAITGNVQQGVDKASEQAKQSSGPLLSLGAGALAGSATGTNKNLFTRTTGAVLNPNLELLFEGPKLREGFQFNFSLSAREEAEAIVIKKIIRFFKQGMSVKRAASTLFLKAPNTFDIKYVYGRTKGHHPWINRIKECALTNFTVNYTPAGNYATFEDGAMTQYDITLSFTELDPIYDDDYTKLDGDADNDIGY
jgi:hypothetical protein